jgi:hypothetical protein
VTLAGSGSGAGLGSRGGTLRFRDDACDRVDAGVAADPNEEPEEPDASDELAARRVDARVILGDMSICIEMNTFYTASTSSQLCRNGRENMWSMRCEGSIKCFGEEVGLKKVNVNGQGDVPRSRNRSRC